MWPNDPLGDFVEDRNRDEATADGLIVERGMGIGGENEIELLWIPPTLQLLQDVLALQDVYEVRFDALVRQRAECLSDRDDQDTILVLL